MHTYKSVNDEARHLVQKKQKATGNISLTHSLYPRTSTFGTSLFVWAEGRLAINIAVADYQYEQKKDILLQLVWAQVSRKSFDC